MREDSNQKKPVNNPEAEQYSPLPQQAEQYSPPPHQAEQYSLSQQAEQYSPPLHQAEQYSPPPQLEGKTPAKGAALVTILLFLLLLQEFLGTSCYSAAVFGIPCAGCGTSRAVWLLLQGRVGDALIMHPLIFITLAFVIIVPVFTLVRLLHKKRGKNTFSPLSARTTNRVFITLALVYFVVYVVRMILYFPHTEPMLYNSNSILGYIISFVRRLFSF